MDLRTETREEAEDAELSGDDKIRLWLWTRIGLERTLRQPKSRGRHSMAAASEEDPWNADSCNGDKDAASMQRELLPGQ